MLDRNKIVEYARSWKETRWRHQGRTRMGIDCAGLIVVVAHHFGVSPDFDATNYRRAPDGKTLRGYFETHLVRKPLPLPQPGDVGMFREFVLPVHCGIFSEVGGVLHLIHATAAVEKTIEEPFAHQLVDRLLRVYEFPGVGPWPA